MTTAAGEYTPLHLPPQFAALAIADPLADPALASSFLLPTSSSSPRREAVPSDADAGGRRGAAAAAAEPPRKAWGSPPRRVQDHGEVVFMEELGASWPVPSRGGPSHKKKVPQSSAEGALGIPFAAVATTATALADSSQVSVSSGGPIARSASICAPVDPVQKQQKEKAVGIWRAQMQGAGPVAVAAASRTDLLLSKANINPRSLRPLLRPSGRQQQARLPMQSGHRGRSPQQYIGNGGGYQQQQPHHQRNTGFFPRQHPAQVIGEYGYQSTMMGLLNPTPEWGFNPSSNLQWGPNPQIAPPRMNTLAPPENLFVRGYFPGPYFPDGLSYAPPFPPIVRPPVGQNPPWFMVPPPPPLVEATLQNQPANPPSPPDDHQLPPEIAEPEAENVRMRLLKQIEYYFSDQNLVKDVYLRTCMDTEGWISVHTIANFPRATKPKVRQIYIGSIMSSILYCWILSYIQGPHSVLQVQSLTKDVCLILAALQTSPTVEVSGDKMRRKGEWSRWIIRRQPLLDANRGELRRDD